MEPGTLVSSFVSRKQKKITIRYPLPTDVYSMLKYINALIDEGTYIRMQGEQISYEEEQSFLNTYLEKIACQTGVLLLAFHEDNVIGASGIESHIGAEGHVGEFGISVLKDFREEGIGSSLMGAVLDQAVQHIPSLEIVSLSVFSNNERAIHLYEKYGFTQYGVLPRGLKRKGMYDDALFMYKSLR